MSVKSLILLVAIVEIILVLADTNPSCMKVPDVKGLNGNQSCCEFPQLTELKVMDECWKEVSHGNESEIVKICKPMQCAFKRYNVLKENNTLDKVAAEKYLDDQLKNSTEWLKVMKPILLEQCLPAIEKDYDKMVQFLKTNKIEVPAASQCTVKPILVTICFAAKAFAKCPATFAGKSMLNDEQNIYMYRPICDEWKKYTNTCTDNIEDILQAYKLLDNMSSVL